MRIAIAARDLGHRVSGPASYALGLIQGLMEVNRHHEIHVYYSDPKALGLFPSLREHSVSIRNRFLWDHWALPIALRRDKIDITIFPKGTLPIVFSGKAIPIMLDLGYFYPELNAYRTPDTLYMHIAMRWAAWQGWGIFTISEATRRDVVRLLKVAPEKILNLYGACQAGFQPVTDLADLASVRKKYELSQPFIFYPASSISPRKNFARLLNAFEYAGKIIPHHLYVTGSLTWKTGDILTRIDRNPRVHRMGLVPFEDMAALYTLAEFTAYPSIFEGLGIPVLEAFQCGSPVLTTKQTSLPEIAGDAALLVDGYDEEEIANGLLKMAHSPELREVLRKKGFEQAKKFTWAITAQKVLGWIENHNT